MLRASPTSPIPATARDSVLPLQYFSPDESYRVPGGLEPGNAGRSMDVPTSTGEKRHMDVVGTLEFTLKGQRMKLTAFAEEGSHGTRLFVPFTDDTSGQETYGGGRYLDLDRSPSAVYVIDFNTAYNPYCAYNERWSCPLTPFENRLKLPIRAGDKLFHP